MQKNTFSLTEKFELLNCSNIVHQTSHIAHFSVHKKIPSHFQQRDLIFYIVHQTSHIVHGN